VGISGAQKIVDHNAATHAHLQPGLLCQLALGTHTESQDDKVCMQPPARLEHEIGTLGAICRLLKGIDGIPH